MAGWMRLQDLIALPSGVHKQSLEQTADTGDYSTVTLRITRPCYDRGLSYLWIQHAPVLEEEAFVDLATLSLSVPGSEAIVLHDTLRYLRWRADVTGLLGDEPSFMLDLVGRER